MSEIIVRIERIHAGPALVIEDALGLAGDFFRFDASSAPGGYDDQAGHGDPDRVTLDDVRAINETMRARSPHAVWEPLTSAGPQPCLRALDPEWDLIETDDRTWMAAGCRARIEAALSAVIGPVAGSPSPRRCSTSNAHDCSRSSMAWSSRTSGSPTQWRRSRSSITCGARDAE